METNKREKDLFCVNHPRESTRIRCSSCDSPICVRCMNEAAVGIKCPQCARTEVNPLTRKRRNKGAAAGLVAATVLGAAAVFLIPSAGFGYLISPAMGLVVGAVVRKTGGAGWGAQAAVAAVCGLALGRLLVGVPSLFLLTPRPLIGTALAAVAAAFAASR